LSFRGPAQSLRDILQAVDRIERHINGMDFEGFREDIKTVDAVERNLQRMSEAANRLGDRAEELCPGPPWRDIRGIGNWLRHQYDRIDLETVWRTATGDLPNLKAKVSAALQRLESDPQAPATE
jgi:uncharacterized protein with HEPN domain